MDPIFIKSQQLKMSNIIRSTIKKLNISQVEVCRDLGINPKKFSRVCTGKSRLLAEEWVQFCLLTNISSDSILDGYIDNLQDAKLELNIQDSGFKISNKYLRHSASKIRSFLPLLHLAYTAYGDRLDQLLDQLKVDTDIFYNFDNQLNLKFILDLASLLIKDGHIDSNNISNLTKFFSRPSSHGKLHQRYKGLPSEMSLIQKFVTNSQKYGVDFKLKIEHMDLGKNKLDLSLKPARHTSVLIGKKDERSKGAFISRYYQSLFSGLVNYDHQNNKSYLEIEEKEKFYGLDKRCLYKIQIRQEI